MPHQVQSRHNSLTANNPFYLQVLNYFMAFHSFFLSMCSTSQRGVVWVLHMTGEKGRTLPHLSRMRDLSTARTATALVSNPWSSTWLVSTCWRVNKPGNSHRFFSSFFSLGAAHSPPHLSGEHVIQDILYSPHCHAPT